MIKVEVVLAGIEEIEKEIVGELKKNIAQLDIENTASLVFLESSLQKEIDALKLELDTPNQKYQDYLKGVSQWTEKRKTLEGNKDLFGTLEFYKDSLSLLESSTRKTEIKVLRIGLIKKIYSEIRRLSVVLSGYYEPVSKFVTDNSENFKEFDFHFSVEMSCGDFVSKFTDWFDGRVSGLYSGLDGRKKVTDLIKSSSFDSEDALMDFLKNIMSDLSVQLGTASKRNVIQQQLKSQRKLNEFYDMIFSLDYLRPKYILKSGEREISKLSPGQKGLLLLYFYLVVDRSDIPLIIDQPEENLDNHTVFDLLVPYISAAKNRRQIFIVTHNPNIAVVCDADQIIWCSLDGGDSYEITYESGSIENPSINAKVIDVLEGTYKAFAKRESKYMKA